jgi:hypothetical protein
VQVNHATDDFLVQGAAGGDNAVGDYWAPRVVRAELTESMPATIVVADGVVLVADTERV